MTECDTCWGTGYVCDNCGDATGDCQCDDHDEVECPDCNGQCEVED